MIDDYSGLQKAAILLITLGPEKASAIFQHLKEDEIESLTLEIANTRSVSPQDKESVLDEYYQVCLAQQYIAEGGITYAKELLETPGVKIKDVANLVGFEDEKYFSRQFHKNTGLSPNEYRAQFISKAETD